MFKVTIMCLALSALGFLLGRKYSSISKQIKYLDLLVLAGAGSSIMFGGKNWYDDALILGFLVGFRGKNTLLIRPKFSINRFFFIYLIFEVFRGLSYFANRNEPTNQLFLWIIFFTVLTFMTLIKYDLDFSKPLTSFNSILIIFILLIFYLAYCCYAIIRFGTTAEIQYAQNPEEGFNKAIWPNTAYITLTMVVFIFILMINMMKLEIKLQLRLAVISVALIGFLSAISLSRSAILLIYSIFASFFFLRSRFVKIRYWNILLTFTFLILVGAFFSESAMADFGKDLSRIELQTDRKEQYLRSIEWLENASISEKLFGNGWRTSGLSLAKGGEESYASSFAPILPVEIGLIGTAIFFVAIFRNFRKIARNNYIYRFQYFVLLCSVLATGAIVNFQTSFLFWLFLL